MNTVNYKNPGAISDPTYVGVDQNRLVVTAGVKDFGTFAATTGQDFTAIPHNLATSMRINNHTGKLIGIRRRHKAIVVDDFEDNNFTNWNGDISTGDELEGVSGALVSGTASTTLTNEVMLSGSEVTVTLKTPSTSTYTTRISVVDDISRIGMDGAGQVVLNEANTESNTKYIVTIRMRESDGKYDAFYEKFGEERKTLSQDEDGVFGANQMVGSLVVIETDRNVVVDPIVYFQKLNYSPEHIGHGASFVYPCVNNTSEYEIINLGSDLMNYSDNSQTISVSGFFAQ